MNQQERDRGSKNRGDYTTNFIYLILESKYEWAFAVTTKPLRLVYKCGCHENVQLCIKVKSMRLLALRWSLCSDQILKDQEPNGNMNYDRGNGHALAQGVRKEFQQWPKQHARAHSYTYIYVYLHSRCADWWPNLVESDKALNELIKWVNELKQLKKWVRPRH